MGEKQPDVYSAVAHVTDGTYHVIKIVRRFSAVEFFVDGTQIKLDGESSELNRLVKPSVPYGHFS